MNLIMLKDFLIDYSTPTIIISLAIAIAKIVLEKKFTCKPAKRLLGIAPFILGIVFCYVYNVVFIKDNAPLKDIVSAGILTGTLSCTLAVFVKKLYKGEPLPQNTALAIIEGLICGYVQDERINAVIKEVYNLYKKLAKNNKKNAIEQISNTLYDSSNGMITSAEFIALSNMIITSLDEIIKE